MQGFPHGKGSAYNVGDLGLIPGSGRSPGEGNGNPLQYSRPENPMDGGAWLAIVHGVAKSRTRLSEFTSQVALVVKNPLANEGDIGDCGLISGSERCPGGKHGYPL